LEKLININYMLHDSAGRYSGQPAQKASLVVWSLIKGSVITVTVLGELACTTSHEAILDDQVTQYIIDCG
jgi:hypothetical protein